MACEVRQMDIDLPVRIERQPDYTTCGPTSLHAIYRYYDDPIELETAMTEPHAVSPEGLEAAGGGRGIVICSFSRAMRCGVLSWTEGTL